MSKSLVVIKPDAVRRGLVGRIIQRIEDKNLHINRIEFRHMEPEETEELYQEHKGKEWFEDQFYFMLSGKCVIMEILTSVKDVQVCKVVRNMMGEYGAYAAPGTSRGDFGLDIRQNLIHCSDSPEAAAREIEIFFKNGKNDDKTIQ